MKQLIDTRAFVTGVLVFVAGTALLAFTGYLNDIVREGWQLIGESWGFEWHSWHVAVIVALLFLVGLIGYAMAIPDSPKTPTTEPSATSSGYYPFVVSDNVRWEDWGSRHYGGMHIGGPLCPDDLTPLRIPMSVGTREPFDSDYIGESHLFLTCVTCRQDYIFSTAKRVETARDEAIVLLTGMRFRGQKTLVRGN